jgi:MFS family permease
VSANIGRIEIVRALFWTHFVAAVLIPFYTDWAGLTLAQIMTLNAWFMAWNFALEIPTGAVADFFGRKWSIVLGAIVASLGCLLYTSTPRYAVFLAAEVVLATGYSLVSGADEALLYDSLVATGHVAEAARRIARLQSAQLVGIVVGALGGTLIARYGGVRAPLVWQAVPIAFAAVVATTLVEPTTAVAPGHGRALAYRALLFSGLRRLRADARLLAIVVDMVLVTALVWTLIWLYQPLLERAGVGRAWFGAMHATLCLAQIGVLRTIDRLTPMAGGRAGYLRVAAAGPAVAMLLLAVFDSPAATVVLLLVAMGFGLSRWPIASTALNAGVDAETRATMLSTVSMLRTLATCLVNPVVGFLADRSLGTALAGLGLATLAVALLSPVGERHLAD